MNYWLFLICAIIFEVSGTTCMKISYGMTRMMPSILMLVFYGLSLAMLALALKKFDVSVAYAIWSGVGTALIAAIGIIYFKEPLTALKIICTAMIIVGVIGLHYSGSGS